MGGTEEDDEEREGEEVESVTLPRVADGEVGSGDMNNETSVFRRAGRSARCLTRMKERKDKLEIALKRNFSAPSLNLHSSYNHGLHIRIGNPHRDSGKIGVSKTAVMIGQSESSKSFFCHAWSQLGADIVDAEVSNSAGGEERVLVIAQRGTQYVSVVLNELMGMQVNAHATSLRCNARIVDELYVTIGVANAADELRLVRPVMNESAPYYVKNGRHPTVELGLLDAGRVCTPNIHHRSIPSSRLHLITGPNMADKSTLLR